MQAHIFSVQGSNTTFTDDLKSDALRVTSVKAWTSAVAAIKASSDPMG